MKKTIQIIAIICLIFSLSFSGFTVAANSKITVFTTGIVSGNVGNEVIKYAENVFQKHLYSFFADGLITGQITDCTLGHYFTVKNTTTNDDIVYFPVLKNGEIIGLLEISYNNYEYTSSYSKSFSEELTRLLSEKDGRNYLLLTDGNILQAFDGKATNDIFRFFYSDFQSTKMLVSQSEIMNYSKVITYEDLTTDLYGLCDGAENGTLAYDGPKAYKTLNVPIVQQTGPNCWAATCASVINYYNGTTLGADDVGRFINPGNPTAHATWTDMQNAYAHWGISATRTDRISFSAVKSSINANDPMHLLIRSATNGHSITLIGYEDCSNTGNGYVLILIEPATGQRRTQLLKSDGNFEYSLGGQIFEWKKTIRF